jgi:hypothetical protein
MVVAIINKTLGSTVIYKTQIENSLIDPSLPLYFDNHFYEKLGTSIWSRSWERIFSSIWVIKSLKTIRFQNQLLAQQPSTILEYKEVVPSWWEQRLQLFDLLLLITALNKKSINQFYFITMGILLYFYGFLF